MLLYKLSKESKKKNICPKKVRKVELDFFTKSTSTNSSQFVSLKDRIQV